MHRSPWPKLCSAAVGPRSVWTATFYIFLSAAEVSAVVDRIRHTGDRTVAVNMQVCATQPSQRVNISRQLPAGSLFAGRLMIRMAACIPRCWSLCCAQHCFATRFGQQAVCIYGNGPASTACESLPWASCTYTSCAHTRLNVQCIQQLSSLSQSACISTCSIHYHPKAYKLHFNRQKLPTVTQLHLRLPRHPRSKRKLRLLLNCPAIRTPSSFALFLLFNSGLRRTAVTRWHLWETRLLALHTSGRVLGEGSAGNQPFAETSSVSACDCGWTLPVS